MNPCSGQASTMDISMQILTISINLAKTVQGTFRRASAPEACKRNVWPKKGAADPYFIWPVGGSLTLQPDSSFNFKIHCTYLFNGFGFFFKGGAGKRQH